MARWIILISGLLTVDISYRISTFEVLLHHTSIISVSHVLYKDNQTFADAEIVVLEISSRQLGILEVLTVSKLDDCRVSYCPYHTRKKLKLMLFFNEQPECLPDGDGVISCSVTWGWLCQVTLDLRWRAK